MLIVRTPGSWNRAGIPEINLNRHQKQQSLGKSTKMVSKETIVHLVNSVRIIKFPHEKKNKSLLYTCTKTGSMLYGPGLSGLILEIALKRAQGKCTWLDLVMNFLDIAMAIQTTKAKDSIASLLFFTAKEKIHKRT